MKLCGKRLVVGITSVGLFIRAIKFAMVNVLPLPVTPRSPWCLLPASRDLSSLPMACSWSPEGLKEEFNSKDDIRNAVSILLPPRRARTMFDNFPLLTQYMRHVHSHTGRTVCKKGVVSLILCVVVPSCLYVSLLSKQLMMVRGHEWEAVMKLFLAFTYPLAALFAMTGIPFFWWSVGISLAVHAGIVAWLKTTPLLSPKKAVCIALCLGMLDFLFVKLFPFPAQIMG